MDYLFIADKRGKKSQTHKMNREILTKIEFFEGCSDVHMSPLLKKPCGILEYNRLSVTLKDETVRKSSSLFFALGKSKKIVLPV